MRARSVHGIHALRWHIVLFATIACTYGRAQPPASPDETRVIIIGVVHKESAMIRADSLLPIIRAVEPDLLLVESDSISGYFTKDLRLKKIPWYHGIAKALRIWPDIPPEMKATYGYHKEKPDVTVKPFDKTIDNRRRYLRDWQQQEREFLKSVNQASEKGLLGDSLTDALQEDMRRWLFYDSIMDQGYFALNQRAITDSARRAVQAEQQLYRALLDSIVPLQSHRDKMMFWMNEWDTRNRIMADRILAYIRQYPGKTILVHTGALHKYYLEDLLSAMQTPNRFRLLEYYEYLAQEKHIQ
jgi:hypothetical protein